MEEKERMTQKSKFIIIENILKNYINIYYKDAGFV
jgi:hypothetical protein